jgi:hypothetical protein
VIEHRGSRDIELGRDLRRRLAGLVQLPSLLDINLSNPPVSTFNSLVIYRPPNRTAMAAKGDSQGAHALASLVASRDLNTLTSSEVFLSLKDLRRRLNSLRRLEPRPLKQAP